MARQKVPGVKKSRLQQLSDARTSRLENGKRRKLDQTIEPRLKGKPLPKIRNSVTQVIAMMTLG